MGKEHWKKQIEFWTSSYLAWCGASSTKTFNEKRIAKNRNRAINRLLNACKEYENA